MAALIACDPTQLSMVESECFLIFLANIFPIEGWDCSPRKDMKWASQNVWRLMPRSSITRCHQFWYLLMHPWRGDVLNALWFKRFWILLLSARPVRPVHTSFISTACSSQHSGMRIMVLIHINLFQALHRPQLDSTWFVHCGSLCIIINGLKENR